MTPELKCSGPRPVPHKLKQYRAAQKRSQELLNEIAYPLSMGLVSEAQKLIRELQQAVDIMAKGIK